MSSTWLIHTGKKSLSGSLQVREIRQMLPYVPEDPAAWRGHVYHRRKKPASTNRARQDAVITLQALIFYPVWNGACDWITAHRTSFEQLFFRLGGSQRELLICRNGSLNEQKIKNNTFAFLCRYFFSQGWFNTVEFWFAPLEVMFILCKNNTSR